MGEPAAPDLMRAADSVLLLVDLQQRLAPAIPEAERLVFNAGRLLTGARRLKLPVLATEHCPAAIGPTLEPLRVRLAPEEIYEKTHFCAAAEAGFRERVAALGRGQWILCGTEAHVCLLQTALGLRALEQEVFVVADAVGSRRAEDRAIALTRLRAAGCGLVTTEMVLFEWLGHAGNPAFKDLLEIIK